MLTPAAAKMLAAPAPVAAERPLGGCSTWRLCAAAGQFSEMQLAGIYSTAVLSQMDLNLDHFVPAAEMQVAQQQLQPATSLAEVLQKLKIQAGPDISSNDFRASDCCATKNGKQMWSCLTETASTTSSCTMIGPVNS